MNASRLAGVGCVIALLAATGVEAGQVPAPAGAEAALCQLGGHTAGAGLDLPGVSIVAQSPGQPPHATATGIDGRYRLSLAPGTYTVNVELTGFVNVERTVTLSPTACRQTLDLTLALAPRGPRQGADPLSAAAARNVATSDVPAERAGRGAERRFQALAVQPEAIADIAGMAFDNDDDDPTGARASIPQGFGAEATADAIAITGDAARINSDMMDDRRDAIARGDFEIGDTAAEVPQVGGDFGGGFRGFGRGGGSRLSITANYTFGGSPLNSAPYALRGEAPEERPFTHHNFGTNLGGPLKIPGLYDGTGRTTFRLGYSGSRGNNLFDRYATVPTDAMRAGDLSHLSRPLIDPRTGTALAGNQIPLQDISPQARALLQYFPRPNLDDATRNYRYLTTTHSTNTSIDVRLTHNFTSREETTATGARGVRRALQAQAGRPGGRGFGGRGRGGAGRRGTNASLTTQVRYRSSNADSANVFSTLGGNTTSSSLGLPVSLNLVFGRMVNRINVNFSRSTSRTASRFSNVQDVAREAGIAGTTTDAFGWGVPAVSFSTLTGLRDVTPSERSDRRTSLSYSWSRPAGSHSIRFGADYRWDRSRNHSEATPNGAFIFTGAYTAGGVPGAGSDFADFLLGLPQRASLQYGPGTITMTGRSAAFFVQDDWRARGNLTLNVGLRYELLWPFVEANGHMVNLDVAPGFTAAAPVVASGVGQFTGDFPAGLLSTDVNNFAPRIGLAWRTNGTTIRGGYGVSFNSTNYAAIARQLSQQPPFATTGTSIGTLNSMLLMADALEGTTAGETTNNFGVDKDYVLGTVHTVNADVSRTIGRSWLASANYTHARGYALDIVRAPNRGPDGLRIPGVQPFLWQTSEGASILDAAAFRLRRRPIAGIGASATYTLARSRDNAPSIGGGGGSGIVAQNEQDLGAEWGLSNFDQRHRFSGRVNVELPFGPDRRWLANGGLWAGLLQDWRLTTSFSVTSGRPLTPRVQGASRDVAQGTNGALRADYDGSDLTPSEQTADRFFNTDAFSLPGLGTFGNSPRNVITGPGSKELDAQFSRDVRLGGSRTLTIQLRANNLLNNVNYQAIDTSVTSPTFGQVLSVSAMRSAQLSLRFRY